MLARFAHHQHGSCQRALLFYLSNLIEERWEGAEDDGQENVEKEMDHIGVYKSASDSEDERRKDKSGEHGAGYHHGGMRGRGAGDGEQKDMGSSETHRVGNLYFSKRWEMERELKHHDRDEYLLDEDFDGLRKEVPGSGEQDISIWGR